MNVMQTQVLSFHRAMGVTVGNTPAIRDAELRVKLIAEEALETIEAIEQNDLIKAADGLADLIYVALGSAVAFGIDLEPVFEEVHATNMRKSPDLRDHTGKILKPIGWVPPKIKELLQAQGAA